MVVSIVVAVSENLAIGKDNQLLWHLPNDMKFFKNTTWAMPVIMGRKTFESLGKPLNGRTNIVITRNEDWKQEGVLVAKSLEQAIELAKTVDAKEAYVIGGGEIYKQALPYCNKLYITKVHTQIDGDTYFPKISEHEWERVSLLDFKADAKHKWDYSFEIWNRIM
ncbi:MAG: dihydrofolate reductase [Chitinophagaceae bacterium]|uniref:dihydrofolate reductase n=1 Tax=unclassified Paraflavitalea TaxID=2798305 RepID=UPI003D348A7B|nr:dihydrofolate reductase [Chitinophagaceae bacterium]